MLDGWERAERAVGELMSKLESDIADYREVRRALKYVSLLRFGWRGGGGREGLLRCPPHTDPLVAVSRSQTRT